MSVTAHRSTLTQLVATIQREDALAQQAGRSMVDHAIRAGEALLEARGIVPYGEFQAWVTKNFPRTITRAYQYMRLAQHQAEIAGAESIQKAIAMLVGVTLENPIVQPQSPLKARVIEMDAAGHSRAEIALALGISVAAVKAHLRPAELKRADSVAHRDRKRAAKLQRDTAAAARELLHATAERLAELRDQADGTRLAGAIDNARRRVADAETHLIEATKDQA